uniref:Fibroblast growth factor n=1 Tax=Paracentrotus lividus TaxID=7656 RepID=B0EVL8_PARLI|nr:fibroblast growth factor 9/16/20 [Paracentrotus lividus]
MKAKMDESGWWSSSIPASKRASHVIIIGFLCVSLAAGLSDDGGLGTRREHADTRQHHHNQQQLHTLSATIRDTADNSELLHNLLATKHSAQISKDSATGHHSSSHSNNNNNINQIIKVSNNTSSSSTTLSKLTASVLSRLNSKSPISSSSGLSRRDQGESLRSRSSMSANSTLPHHLRPSSQADAVPSNRVKRKASSRGGNNNPLIYKAKQPTQLFCRTNFRLAVHEDGTINGTRDNMDVYSSLYIQSQRRSIVSIKGLRSQLYVCVNDDGDLYGANRVSRNCYFQEKIEPNFFNTYAYKMPDSTNKRRRRKHTPFLSINKYGESRIAKVRTQKKAQFIPLVPPEELL